MQVDYLIIGQGLCGSWLSYFLLQEGASVLVIDQGTVASASRAASGIINPITGKRLARQWMGETILPFARQAYATLGLELNQLLAEETSIHTFFSSSEEAQRFEQKAELPDNEFLHPGSRFDAQSLFNSSYGSGTIHPALLVNVPLLLDSWRGELVRKKALLPEAYSWDACELTDQGVRYKGISARAVIDCTGSASAENPYFSRLPFALNKGEAILASIPGLPANAVYKYAQLSIVPWTNELFWIGSTFDWDFTDPWPTEAFRQKAESILTQWLRLPYNLQEHFAAIRPATVTRDVFSGMHPQHRQVGILNGMGSKGCSLAPFIAHNFAQHLMQHTPMLAQMDVQRYERILKR